MNNHQITALLCSHPRTRRLFKGVYSADNVPVSRPEEASCYVVNLDDSSEPGSHWTSIYISPAQPSEFFDSFGLECTIPRLEGLLGETYLHCPVQLQSVFTSSCGQHCLYYILGKSYKKDLETKVLIFASNVVWLIQHSIPVTFGCIATSDPRVCSLASCCEN